MPDLASDLLMTPGESPAPHQGSRVADDLLLGGSAGFSRPEWSDQGISLERRSQDFLETHARQGTPWEEVSRSARGHFGGDEGLRAPYQRMLRMQEARQRAADRGGPDVEGWVARRATPFVSTALSVSENVRAGRAQQRLQDGRPLPGDYDLIAEREAEQRRESGLGRQIAGGLAGVPAVLGEFALGGAALRGAGLAGEAAAPLLSRAALGRGIGQAALAPSTWAPQWTQHNTEAGRDPMDLRGLPPAAANATLQNMLFGSLAGAADRIPGEATGAMLRRLAARTGIGFAEQQGLDVLGSVINHHAGLNTGYGVMDDLLNGRQGEALQGATVQLFTLGAFAALHGRHGESRQIVRDAVEQLDRSRRAGASPEAAANRVSIGSSVDAQGNVRHHFNGREVSESEMNRRVEELTGVPQGPPASARRVQPVAPQEAEPHGPPEANGPPPPDRVQPMTPEEASAGLEAEARRQATAGTPRGVNVGAPGSQTRTPPEAPAPEPNGPHELYGPPEPQPRFHVVNYKEPARSVDTAIGMLERRGTAPRPLETWTDAENARGQAAPGTASLVIDRAAWSGEVAGRTGIDNLRGGRHPLPYEPGLRQVVYRGDEGSPNHGKLREVIDRINAERADASLMREYGLDGPLPPVELVARGRPQEAPPGPPEPTARPQAPPEPPRAVAPPPRRSFASREESAAAANLTGPEAVVVHTALRGDNFQAAAAALGMTPQGAGKVAKRALEKLKATDPDNWGKYGSLVEVKREGLGFRDLTGGGAEVLPASGPTAEAALRARVAGQGQSHAALDSNAPPAEVHGSAPLFADEIGHLARQARRHGQTVYDALVDKYPELVNLPKRYVHDLINTAAEYSDALAADSQHFGGDTAPLQREHQRLLQESAEVPQGAAAGEGGAEPEGAAAPEGPGQTAPAAPPAASAPAPADAPGGPAGGGELTPQVREREPDMPKAQRVGPGLPEPPPDPAAELVRNLAAQEAGFGPGPGMIASAAKAVYERAKAAAAEMSAQWGELGGRQAPRTTALSRRAGEAMTRYNAAPGLAREAAPHFLDLVMPRGVSKEQRMRVGGAYDELHARWMKFAFQGEARRQRGLAQAAIASGDRNAANEAYRAEGENLDLARSVVSTVGADNNPLRTEADFQAMIDHRPLNAPADWEAALNSSALRETTARWRQHMVPEMERNFRTAQGMADADPIHSLTQIPNFPMNRKVVRAGDAVPDAQGTAWATKPGGGRGNLKNVRIGRLGFARKATGAAEGYEIDLGAIISNSLEHGYVRAAKAEMFRAFQEEGVGRFVRPGERPEGFGQRIPDVNPPLGTQEAGRGQTDFVVRDGADGEFRRALAPDSPFRLAGISNALRVPVVASLASTVEATAHAKNLLTHVFQPGASLYRFFKNAVSVMKGNRETNARLVELARIGALKEKGFEAGLLWGGKTDPTVWVGKFLDVIQRAARLNLDQAFDKLLKKGWNIEDSETNRRDFINQMGNYNLKSQHKLVALARDTGIGPFATTGFTRMVRETMAMFGGSGLRTGTWGTELGLRAVMLGKMASVVALGQVVNKLLWGRWDGDDNTPAGGVHVGRDDRGSSMHIDLLNFIGVTRSPLAQAALAYYEGRRPAAVAQGATASGGIGRGLSRGAQQLLHPLEGPGVATAHTLLTGKNLIGRPVAARGRDEGEQLLYNFYAALRQANPVVSSLSGQGESPQVRPSGWERAMGLLGPFGVRYRRTPPGRPQRQH